LQADNTATGSGTVSFTSGNVALSNGSVTIYYNPAHFGTQDPIYSGGTLPTQYMLINSLSDLETLSNTPTFWNQNFNFALNNNIDASSTANLNNGAGFTPIGNTITPFSGLFDSQGHSISHLAITVNPNSPLPIDGLFGVVSTPSSASFNFNISGTAKLSGNTIFGATSYFRPNCPIYRHLYQHSVGAYATK